MLTRSELNNLVGLYQSIEHTAYGTKDLMERDRLENKATDEQYHAAKALFHGGTVDLDSIEFEGEEPDGKEGTSE